jgi:hypothetical protein
MKTTAITFAIGVCLYVQLGYSQDNSQVVAIIKTMPSTVLDFDNTFTLGVEVPLNAHWAIQQDIGWGNAHTAYWQSLRNQYPNKTNWRFRTQARYYSNESKYIDGRTYIGIEYFRKDVFINELKNVGQGCSQPFNCAYFEESNVRTHRVVSAFHLKFGCQMKFSQRLLFDVFTGFGIREIVTTNNLSPQQSNASFFPRGFFAFESLSPSRTSSGSISLGFNVGYQINKKSK